MRTRHAFRPKVEALEQLTEIAPAAPAAPLPPMPPARNGRPAAPAGKAKAAAVADRPGGAAAGKGNAVLRCEKWSGGQAVTDDQGRRWTLVHGAPDLSGPRELTGWLLEARGGLTHFFSSTGQLYRLTPDPLARAAQ
jgi:hypothetical protein